jgi:neutral ceramidase
MFGSERIPSGEPLSAALDPSSANAVEARGTVTSGGDASKLAPRERPLARGLAIAILAHVAFGVLVSGSAEARDGWRAGVGRVDITPTEPSWLAGYASRTRPSTGVLGPIQVKALALEDADGLRLVAVTCDLLGIPRSLADPVTAEISARHALPRSRILLTASHSHSAPVIRDALVGMYGIDEAGRASVTAYTERVRAALVQAASTALGSLRPASVSTALGQATFGKNRRMRTPADPSDPRVPVLAVDMPAVPGRDGADPLPARRAALFVYACHNTTLDGPDICGDWAGFAQEYLEARNTDLTALFASGCGGDQNPLPRRTIELCKQYGDEMARAVEAVLAGSMRVLEPTTRAAFGTTPLPLVPAPDRASIENDTRSDNRYIAVRARSLLERLDSDPTSLDTPYPYAAQVWRLGHDHIIAALSGEAVVEYSLRLTREVPAALGLDASTTSATIIAYANDCPAYIPSEKVLREGGYEGADSMIYYGLHGPWAPGVEARVVSHVLALARSLAEPSAVTDGLPVARPIWAEGAFNEGPTQGPDGALWFTDIPRDRILRISSGNVHEVRRPSGKANGLVFDDRGRLIACEGADGGARRVTRTELDGSIVVLAEKFRGQRLNSPNDVTIDSEGRVYFSDPRYVGTEPRELDIEGVYRVQGPGEEPELVIDDAGRPNGLAVSPEGDTLYVSDTSVQTLLAYRLTPRGKLPRIGVVFDFRGGRGVDGMEVDSLGNIFAAAGSGPLSGLWVISPRGELLEFVPLPEAATNCAFGGVDGRSVYITSERSVHRVRTRVPGLAFSSNRTSRTPR